MTPLPGPEPEKWLQNLETIKVFCDSLRLKIIKLMQEPATVKQVAEALGLAPAKLYYHVNLLHKHDLIRVVDHNLETGIVEKIYQVTARQFKLVNPLVAGGDFPAEAASALFGSMLEETALDFLRAFANREANEGQPPRHPFFSKKAFRLTEAQLTELHAQFDQLIRQVTALAAENAHIEEAQYELTLVFYKSVPE